MGTEDGDDLVGEVVERTLWAFPDVDLRDRPGVGQRSVAERILVGWATPSDALAREAAPGPVDASRLAGFTPARRQSFLTGRAVVGRLLGSLYPGSVAWTLDTAPGEGGAAGVGPLLVRGVPALASVAYADGIVVAVAAAANQASRIGVDVERLDPARATEVAKSLGVPVDGALARWTLSHAVLKAGWHGRRADVGLVRIGGGTGRVEGSSMAFRLAEVDGPKGYTVGVAWQPTTRSR
ncbi:MAG: hypothetical protein KDB60_01400 [Propionibacteriaceae bacterium]|nr:hypothetical protein [Propionibacteriaceae bacterium]